MGLLRGFTQPINILPTSCVVKLGLVADRRHLPCAGVADRECVMHLSKRRRTARRPRTQRAPAGRRRHARGHARLRFTGPREQQLLTVSSCTSVELAGHDTVSGAENVCIVSGGTKA